MKKDSKATIKQIVSEYIKGLKGYKKLFFLTIGLFTVGSLLDVIIPYFYKDFFNQIVGLGTKAEIASGLIQIIILIATLHLVSWLFNRTGFFLLVYTGSHTIAQIKQRSFNYLIKHSHNFFTNSFTGSLVQRIQRNGRAFDRIFDTIVFNFVPLMITVTGSIIITYFSSKTLALILLVWIVIYFTSSVLFYRWRMKYNIEMAKIDSETTGLLSDDLSNNQTISLFNGFEREQKNFKEATVKQAKYTVKTWSFAGVYDSIQLLFVYVAEFMIFYYAIKYWQADKLTVGGIVMVQIYVVSLIKQIWTVNMIIRNVIESISDSKEMTDIMLTPHEIVDAHIAKDLIVPEGKIEFKNVVFNFNETRSVLDSVNCEIKAGQKVALIGASGAGKTTFVRLILRLYNLTGGQILIDGQNISQVTQESLRHNISLVPQDPVLFHRTLKENIRYGKPEATDEEVIKAAQLAHCDDFIEALPNKYETLVGERGIKLSGGERQRIAIARAILKNAPILILDEATSSLDSHSEALIQKALDNLMKSCTTIAIAHRLSTIRKMDRIIVMESGKIIEDGTHEELANKDSGLYKDLWELQAGGFIQKEE
ncbi:MAG: ABC transporter ATP-binding protein [bacterium]